MHNPPKNHHYLPICYLKSFTDSQNKMWRQKKNENKVSQCSPAQVCYEYDFFKLKLQDSLEYIKITDEYHIEKNAFKKQENNYGKILQNVIKFSLSPIVIDKGKYRLFLETVFTIKKRNPKFRDGIINNFINFVPSQENRTEFQKGLIEGFKRIGEEYDIDIVNNFDFERYTDDFFNKKVRDPNRMLDIFLSTFLDNSERNVVIQVTNDLYRFKQFILHAPLNMEFITSDNPGFTVNVDSIKSIGGFAESFIFYFPLSPKTCLMIDSGYVENKLTLEKTVYPKLVDNVTVNEININTKNLSDNKTFACSKYCLTL